MASFAEKNVDLFTTKTLVINQTAEVRRQAIANGLATVLVRLSGTRALLNQPLIETAIKNASGYLYEFSYQSTEKSITILGAEKPASLLVMRFSKEPLEQLLKSARLPIWSANRPDVLVWTVESSDTTKNYVSDETVTGAHLRDAAKNRGLPVSFPILDLDDRSALPVVRLWALDEEGIQMASSRYQTDAVLAGRIRQDQDSWVGNYLLLYDNNIHYFSAQGTRLSEIAQSIVDQVTDYFANIYAVTLGTQAGDSQLVIQVNNIDDYGRYIKVLNYLESLTPVKTSTLTQINFPTLQVRLSLNTGLDQLLNTLRLDKKLVLEESTVPTPQASPIGTLVTSGSNIDNTELYMADPAMQMEQANSAVISDQQNNVVVTIAPDSAPNELESSGLSAETPQNSPGDLKSKPSIRLLEFTWRG